VLAELEPIRERRARLTVADALAALDAGNDQARIVARATMAAVRDALELP